MTPPSTPALLPRDTRTFGISVGLLVLRLGLGWIFIFHGAQKLFGVFGGPGMTPFAAGLSTMMPGFLPPMAWAYMAALGEFFGGVGVLLGLLTRAAALPLLVVMWVAIAHVHGKGGFNTQGGYEYNVALIAMAATLLVSGPGLLSLDAYLFRPRSTHA